MPFAPHSADMPVVEALHQLPLPTWWPVGVAVIVLLTIFKSPKFKGRLGEWMVIRFGLSRLDRQHYCHFSDLYLPRHDGTGTTQIDHVVVSPFGIFVIETKNYRGWIFGGETQGQWTQQIYRKKSQFQNPLHQNQGHVKALAEFLGLTADRFRPVVIFVGSATFKTPMPSNVLNRGLTSWIRSHQQAVLTPTELSAAREQLQALDASQCRRQAEREHRRFLDAREG